MEDNDTKVWKRSEIVAMDHDSRIKNSEAIIKAMAEGQIDMNR